MDDNIMKTLPEFLTTLGLDEAPMGIFHTPRICDRVTPVSDFYHQ